MTIKRPIWMQPGGGDPTFGYSALDLRAILTVFFHNEGVANSVFADMVVSQRAAGANFSVDVSEGLAVILGDDVDDQGYYLCQSTATENLVIPAPPLSGTRIHRVVAQVRDKLHNGTHSTYDWALQVLEDTDGSGPPALPNSALSLATVSVAAGQVSVQDANIADTRVNATPLMGRPRWVGVDSSRPKNPVVAEIIYRTDHGYLELYDGSAWRVVGPPPSAVQVESATDIAGFSNTTFAAGSPVCGTAFTAPASGSVFVTVSGRLHSSNNTQEAVLGWELRTGAVVGSGTVTLAASSTRALVTSKAVNTDAQAQLGASYRYLVTGLTGGSAYNVRTMHVMSGGTGTIMHRTLLVEPAP